MKHTILLLVAASCRLGGEDAPADVDAGTDRDAGSGAPVGDRDPSGFGETLFANGPDPANPFFASLGTNGRACATCHVQASGWTLTPPEVQARFAATGGTDPLFRALDGANAPTADVSTVAARQAAYSMLLRRAVIRVGLPVPASADFTLAAADDPYGYASAAELSLFRRPLPATNLRFLTSTMWDAREPSLAQQATDATLGHAQASAADAAQIASIVAFERSLTTAQRSDDAAGALDAGGATGGPAALAAAPFTVGENDPFSGGFDRDVFALYDAWPAQGNDRRAAIARGERIFDNRPIAITNVAGLTDQPGRATIHGTCTTCHDATSVGDHSVALLLDLGVAAPQRRTPDQPLYTFRRTADGATVRTTDPGLALTTGRFADLSKFKVPVLRALAMRAPYFHDGSAPTLAALVQFYDTRFHLGLSPGERADLAAFLSAL